MAELGDDAALVASELVTNAAAAGHSIVFAIALERDTAVVLRAYDDGPGVPEERHPDDTDTAGRGLLIVKTLAAEWGCYPADDGKVVWARLRQGPGVPAASSRHRELDAALPP